MASTRKPLITGIFALIALVVVVGAVWAAVGGKTDGTREAAKMQNVASASGGNQAAADKPWNLRCAIPKDSDGTEERCEIFQRLSVKESGKRLVEVAIGPADANAEPDENGVVPAAKGVVILPLGIMLQPGVVLQIDEGQVYRFNARTCVPNGCIANIDLPTAMVDEMKQGKTAKIMFIVANGQKAAVPLVLDGFSAAYGQI